MTRQRIERLRALAKSTTFPAERDEANRKADALEAKLGPEIQTMASAQWEAADFMMNAQRAAMRAAMDAMRAHAEFFTTVEEFDARVREQGRAKAIGRARLRGATFDDGSMLWTVPGYAEPMTEDELVQRFSR